MSLKRGRAERTKNANRNRRDFPLPGSNRKDNRSDFRPATEFAIAIAKITRFWCTQGEGLRNLLLDRNGFLEGIEAFLETHVFLLKPSYRGQPSLESKYFHTASGSIPSAPKLLQLNSFPEFVWQCTCNVYANVRVSSIIFVTLSNETKHIKEFQSYFCICSFYI